MEDAIRIEAMHPDKLANSWILGDYFVSTIRALITSPRSKNVDVVLKVWGYLRLCLQDECNIVLEDCGGVCPPLGEDRESKGSEWCLKRSNVARLLR
jgi:hypothetical protein